MPMATCCFRHALDSLPFPFAAIISWLLFDEPSTLMSICGMLLITTAGIGATIITKRAEARGIAPVEGKVAAEGSKE